MAVKRGASGEVGRRGLRWFERFECALRVKSLPCTWFYRFSLCTRAFRLCAPSLFHSFLPYDSLLSLH